MFIHEGSDTQIRVQVKQIKPNEENFDLKRFTGYVMSIAFCDGDTLQLKGRVDELQDILVFDIFSEFSIDRSGPIKVEFWGVKGEKRVRLNKNSIKGKVTPSLSIPEWQGEEEED